MPIQSIGHFGPTGEGSLYGTLSPHYGELGVMGPRALVPERHFSCARGSTLAALPLAAS
ncbi:UNVERIFIED_ORG: hypothetical protein ABIB52_004210 [Arthrobacter sp. UYCu721]